MPSKLFVALISLTLLSAAACRSNDGAGQTTNASGNHAAVQPTAPTSVAVSNTAPAATPAAVSPAPGMPPMSGATNNPNADACKLLTSEEIQAVQGEGLKGTKGTDASAGPFAVSQCFYETASFINSISLTLTSKNPDAKGESPRDFWKENFGGERGRDGKEREKEEREREEREKKGGARVEEEEGEGLPPTPVKGIGDDAYWLGNDKVGTLYVLKGNRFIRISLGGGDKQEKKIEKSKTLAARALKRL